MTGWCQALSHEAVGHFNESRCGKVGGGIHSLADFLSRDLTVSYFHDEVKRVSTVQLVSSTDINTVPAGDVKTPRL